MDLLSRIASWLGENEATISAVVGIMVLAGALVAGTRSLLGRSAATSAEKLSGAGAGETTSATDSSARKLVLSSVDPGFVKWLSDGLRKAGLKE